MEDVNTVIDFMHSHYTSLSDYLRDNNKRLLLEQCGFPPFS